MYERKFEKRDLSVTETNIDAENKSQAWDKAIAKVSMDVAVLPAMVNQPMVDEDREVTSSEDRMLADYVTDTGREGKFFMVMIDRNRDGNWKALSPCSDYYAAVKPENIYTQLRNVMGHIDCEPIYVYNSLSGGSQELILQVNNMESIDETMGMKMEVLLLTSLDRSSNHVLTVRPVTETGVPIYFQDTGKGGFNFKVKHTTGAKTEIENFNQAAAHIVHNWNDKIVPYIKFLNDGELNEQDVAALLTNIVEDAGLPEKAVKEIETAYKQDWIDMGDGASAALKAIGAICQYNEDNSKSPMDRQRKSEKIGKSIASRVGQLFRKYAE